MRVLTSATRPSAVACALACSCLAHAQWRYTNLHPAGSVQSQAAGVGAGGQAGFVQVGPTMGHMRASVWNGTSAWVNLHPPGMDYSMGHGAGDGQQVGEAVLGGVTHASLWMGTAASWIDLQPAGASSSIAWGAGGGKQVGVARVLVGHAALWSGTAASWIDLNPPPHPITGMEYSSEAYGTDGPSQVGYVYVAGYNNAALWRGTAGSWVNLHPASAINSYALGVSGTEQVGYTYGADNIHRASLWTGSAGSWVDLNPAGAAWSFANGVHNGEQVGRAMINGNFHASFWTGTAASWVDLQSFMPANFLTSEAYAIWHDGILTYVTGYAYNTATTRGEAILWWRPTCLSDFNLDGFSDAIDYDLFIAAWLGGSASADINTDGFTDALDYDQFIIAWSAGC